MDELEIGNKNIYLGGKTTASQRLLQARGGIDVSRLSLSYMLLIALGGRLRGLYRDITPTLLNRWECLPKALVTVVAPQCLW